ncbi:hypothetical protein [Streptomyces zhaozhouensis]|nr:hypothetical protein [Streptomyces zhaozhouensis]
MACWLRGDQTTVYEFNVAGGVPPGCMPVVVCRYTAQEMLRLTTYLASWPTGGVPRPWLVLMRDAPLPPPRPARFRRRALGARVLGVTEVPYLVPLRSVDSPEEGLTFRVVAQAAVRLRRDLGL